MSTLKGIPVVIVESGGVPITLYQDAPLATNVSKAVGGMAVTIDEHIDNPHALPLNVANYDPPPSPPSGPLEIHVPEVDGLVNFTHEYTATTGKMLVRIFGRMNSTTHVDMSVTWAGDPLVKVAEWPFSFTTPRNGSPYSAIFAIPDGQTGTHDLVITCAAGEVGVAAIRLAEATDIATAWQGDSGSYGTYNGSTTGCVYGLQNSTPNETMFTVAGWCTDFAHPVNINAYGTTESGKNVVTQWSTWVSSPDGLYATSAAFSICETSDATRTFVIARSASSAPFYCGSCAQINGVVM